VCSKQVQDSSKPLVLDAVEQDVESAANALLRARCDYILLFARGLQCISDTPIGEELAVQLYTSLMVGRRSQGRVEFFTQKDGVTHAEMETWTLSRGRVSRADESQCSILEQIRRFGMVRTLTQEQEAHGEIRLIVGGRSEGWRSKDAFVDFWSSMSERWIAACFMGSWYANAGRLGGMVAFVQGNPMRQLRVLASSWQQWQREPIAAPRTPSQRPQPPETHSQQQLSPTTAWKGLRLARRPPIVLRGEEKSRNAWMTFASSQSWGDMEAYYVKRCPPEQRTTITG